MKIARALPFAPCAGASERRATVATMHFPKFWAKGQSDGAHCWRWSETSAADAQAQADARAKELAEILASGVRLDRYSYGNRPLREEIVETHAGIAITRNLYGALILNTERVMFIDIDCGEDASGERRGRDQVARWSTTHPDLGLRVYRTAAGLRVLVTNQTFDPEASESAALLAEVGSDPLYVKLCRAQASFRARLTPKPWRVGMRPPRLRWPFEDADVAARYAQWVAGYDQASAARSVCKLVETLGPAEVAPDVAPVLALHDQRAVGERPLA
jgi:hypothetical protein